MSTQHTLTLHGNHVRALSGVTPRLVAQDVALILGGTWQGQYRLARKLGVSARSMSFALVKSWAGGPEGKPVIARMVTVGVHGLQSALSKGVSPFCCTNPGEALQFRLWIENTVLPALTAGPVSGATSERRVNPVVVAAPSPTRNQLNTLSSDTMVKVSTEDKILYTTSLVIAQGVGNDHESVIKLVRKYTSQLEKFGLIRFEIQLRAEGQRGKDTKYAILNEPQATSVLALMGNSDPVVSFKFRLVDAFYRMRDQLQTKSTALATPRSNAFSALDLHQSRMNEMLTKGQKLLADELKLLRDEHEDLEARVAALAAAVESGTAGKVEGAEG
jgi:phage regulator Rha-like protein